MTFEDAIVKSIKSYFKGVEPSELMKASPKRMKYTKKYFDAVGEEHGVDPVDLKKSDKSSSKTKPVGKENKSGY